MPTRTAKLDPAEATLTTPLEAISGVTAREAQALRLLEVRAVGHLLAHLPMRHERIEAEACIRDLAPETLVSVRGDITATRIARSGKTRFQAVLVDETGRLDLIWFNMPYLRDRIHPGMRLRVQGKAGRFGGGLQIVNPKWEILDEKKGEPEQRGEGLRPVYPASEHINSARIERIARDVVPHAARLIEDHLPDDFRRSREMVTLSEAYRLMHLATTEEEVAEARRRLAYDELLLLQLGVYMKRRHLREGLRAPALKWSAQIDEHIRARLRFTLTEGQEGAIRDIAADLARDTPTNRLVQGDVGSGKTVVALYAMLMAVASGHQAALMAPTELLAEQHYASISQMLAGSQVRLALLTGGMPAAERDSLLARLESGDLDLLIGTHALLTKGVEFKSLAVAIIDEQHRFGVHQRAVLRSKGATPSEARAQALDELPLAPTTRASSRARTNATTTLRAGATPHVIVMTATPIPRTIALSLFGALDVSTIAGLPPGRQPVQTRLVNPARSPEVYKFVRQKLDAGEQAYIVVPAIDTGASSGDGAAAAEGRAGLNDLRSLHKRLEENELKGLRLAALHGRLKRSTREQIMARFRAGSINALIATTVIEVGVDVPNATVMVIEHADRFGLAQLHQLRGRIGRGTRAGTCILVGEALTDEARARLAIMEETTDGFKVAECDLEIRGPGEVFGLKQSGVPPFKVADLMRDKELLELARRDAADWIERSPTLDAPEEATLNRRLFKAHGQWLGLGDVG